MCRKQNSVKDMNDPVARDDIGLHHARPADGDAAIARLHAAQVIFSPREGAVRLAPYCFNTTEDVDRALAALEG